MPILPALLLQAAGPAPAPAASGAPAADPQAPHPDDIVVVARSGKCSVAIANRLLSDREFKAKAAEWRAGRSVAVHVPPGSSLRCEATIMFRLNDFGVTRATFIDE